MSLVAYWHVLLLAAPVALVGWLLLTPVRRAAGIGNDSWAWAGLLAGAVVVLAGYVTGTVDLASWLRTSAHRVTEFTALAAWWIISLWAVTAGASPAYRRRDGPGAGSGDGLDQLVEGTGTAEVETLGELASHGP
jgi:hypothetical protein